MMLGCPSSHEPTAPHLGQQLGSQGRIAELTSQATGHTTTLRKAHRPGFCDHGTEQCCYDAQRHTGPRFDLSHVMEQGSPKDVESVLGIPFTQTARHPTGNIHSMGSVCRADPSPQPDLASGEDGTDPPLVLLGRTAWEQ